MYGPPPALIDFLKERVARLVAIFHPFAYCSYTRSSAKLFSDSKMVCEKVLLDIRGPEILVFLKDVVSTLYFILRHKIKCEVYVGADCLNALMGVFLRKIGLAHTVVYYTIDYTPYRFENPIKNGLYHCIDLLSVRSSDYVWNLANRMVEVRERQGILKERNLLVPVGVSLKKIEYPEETLRFTMVFLSHLVKSKGLQLIFEAFS